MVVVRHGIRLVGIVAPEVLVKTPRTHHGPSLFTKANRYMSGATTTARYV